MGRACGTAARCSGQRDLQGWDEGCFHLCYPSLAARVFRCIGIPFEKRGPCSANSFSHPNPLLRFKCSLVPKGEGTKSSHSTTESKLATNPQTLALARLMRHFLPASPADAGVCQKYIRRCPPRALHGARIRQAQNRPQGLFRVQPHPQLVKKNRLCA